MCKTHDAYGPYMALITCQECDRIIYTSIRECADDVIILAENIAGMHESLFPEHTLSAMLFINVA